MKSFNRMPLQQKIQGHFIPTGAFYGKLDLKFTRKVRIKKYRVTDKFGHIVYNEDGTEKTRYIYRNDQCKQTVYYSVESTKLYKNDNGELFLKIWLAYDNHDNNIYWNEVVLGDSAMTKQLNLFIIEKIDQYCEDNNIKWDDIKIEPIKFSQRKNILTTAPHAKHAQSELIYKGIPMQSIDDTDVKPRAKIVHSNLKNCKGDAPQHEKYASPYQWEYGKTPKKSGNIEIVAAMNSTK